MADVPENDIELDEVEIDLGPIEESAPEEVELNLDFGDESDDEDDDLMDDEDDQLLDDEEDADDA